MKDMTFNVVAQIPSDKLDQKAPHMSQEGSTAIPWMLVAVFVLGIIAIAFKTSKRTHMEQ